MTRRHVTAATCWAGFFALLVATLAHGQALAPQPVPPEAGVTQALGAAVPLAATYTDSQGRRLTLHEALAGRPTLLALGYYRCPQLCGVVMRGLLQALHDSGLPPEAYRVLRLSIDPDDRPADAAARRAADLTFARTLGGATPVLDALVGTPAEVAAVSRAIGYRAERAEPGNPNRYAHPAVVVLLTPEGRVSRYLMGVQFDPADVQDALLDAAAGRTGRWTDRLALLCAHLDPRLGRHSAAVLAGTRAMGVALVLLLAVGGWRLRRRRR
ncbi:MAG: SCO family protein [Rhizobacter sp.]|nr:SCO family protein [Rhizobacter sp.]